MPGNKECSSQYHLPYETGGYHWERHFPESALSQTVHMPNLLKWEIVTTTEYIVATVTVIIPTYLFKGTYVGTPRLAICRSFDND